MELARGSLDDYVAANLQFFVRVLQIEWSLAMLRNFELSSEIDVLFLRRDRYVHLRCSSCPSG